MNGRLNVFVGLKASISCLEGLGCWPYTTLKDAGCDALMLTFVVELLQSVLEVVVLLSELTALLVWKLVEYLVL